MNLLLDKLGTSVDHLKCLAEVFDEHHSEYHRIEELLKKEPFYEEISRELYAGGKALGNSKIKLARQMILGDIVEYIFTGRAYYYAAKSKDHFKMFLKLILYSVNQLLIFDSITIDFKLRNVYIAKLNNRIEKALLYEKKGDRERSEELLDSCTTLNDSGWQKFDAFIDSILPKTLGTPKELVVFAELMRLKKGTIIPLLLIQRLFGDTDDTFAPPDFLLAKENKDIFGIEVGYGKEPQCREFTLRTSIPTVAVDLSNHLHNRCPICGMNILYCDPVIEAYSEGVLDGKLSVTSHRFECRSCDYFDNGNCNFSNYYGKYDGKDYKGDDIDPKSVRHYHTSCILKRSPSGFDPSESFGQIPQIEGIELL